MESLKKTVTKDWKTISVFIVKKTTTKLTEIEGSIIDCILQ